jgi:hypothetical protein
MFAVMAGMILIAATGFAPQASAMPSFNLTTVGAHCSWYIGGNPIAKTGTYSYEVDNTRLVYFQGNNCSSGYSPAVKLISGPNIQSSGTWQSYTLAYGTYYNFTVYDYHNGTFTSVGTGTVVALQKS